MNKILIALLALPLLTVACDKPAEADAKGSDTVPAAADKPAAAPAAAEPTCEEVVNKLASFQENAGEPERKLWGKMCATMPAAMKTCLVAANTKEDRDECGRNKKLIDKP